MNQPTLNYVLCPGAARAEDAKGLPESMHRMAYWEWNTRCNAHSPHVVVCAHGLTRQGRDFDVLAQTLSGYARVICPDVVGRGASDWLANPMAYGIAQYVNDMLALLTHVNAQAPIHHLYWVGTSMGGLIGMCLAALPQLGIDGRLRRLVLNDVGPCLEPVALERIAAYVGQHMLFDSLEAAAAHLRALSQGFGPHSDAQWMALTAPMLRVQSNGQYLLHYDPRIVEPMRAMTVQDAAQGQALLWAAYDTIQVPTLLLRGAQSDLLSAQTAQEMGQRGPRAHCVTLENVGHAPTLVDSKQVQVVSGFLFG